MKKEYKLREINAKYRYKGKITDDLLDSPSKAYELFLKVVDDLTVENFIAFYLDNGNRLIGYSLIGKGSDIETLSSRKVTFQKALLVGAVNLILLHNHPTNDLTPSDSDITVTSAFIDAANLLEMNILDHIVVGENSFISIREQGLVNF